MKNILLGLIAIQFSYSQNTFPTNGNVGIGTATPSAKLDVSSTGVAAFFRSTLNSVPLSIFNAGSSISTIGFKGSTSATEYNVRIGADGNDFIAYTNNVERMRLTSNGNVGIGTTNPSGKLEIIGNSGIYNDFASYSGTTVNNYLPNGKEPTLIINENLAGTFTPAVGGQITYRGGLSFGRGGPGIYSVNPNPAGSGYYGEIRFHTTYWNGSDYNNADRMVIKLDGNVGIGTLNPTSKLTVAGDINSREVKVTVNAGADFVFAEDYDLPSLPFLENYIKENKHLPEIASAKEMQTNGINLSEMNIKLLQKVEELTLYMIEQNKKLEVQQKENTIQSKKIEVLEKENEAFKSLSERLSQLESQLK